MKLRALITAAAALAATLAVSTPAMAQTATGSISGRVTGANDQPLADASVYLDSAIEVRAITNEFGVFTIADVPEGLHSLRATAVDYLDASTPVNVGAGGVATAQVSLRRIPATVSGRVLDGSGNPLAGIAVGGRDCCSTQAMTGADGAYELSGISVAPVTFSAHDASGLYRFTTVTLDLLPGEVRTDVDFTMASPGGPLTGQLVDSSGTPVTGAQISWQPCISCRPVTTRGDGRFAIDEPGLGGSLEVTAWPTSSAGLLPTTVTFDVLADQITDVTMVAVSSGSITGTLALDGVPNGGTVISLEAYGPLPRTSSGVASFTSTDRFSIGGLAPGDYVVVASPQSTEYVGEFYPDAVTRATAQVVHVTGGSATDIAIDLERSAEITGTITGPDGGPAFGQPQAFVASSGEVLPEVGPCQLDSGTNNVGMYRLGCLRPDTAWIIKLLTFDGGNERYYDGSESFANATPVTVAEGAVLSGVDFQVTAPVPGPTFESIEPNLFRSGQTTLATIRGTGFPTDPNALVLAADSNFGEPPVSFRTISILSPTEAVIEVTPGGPLVGMTLRQLVLHRSTGGSAPCTCEFWVADPETPTTGTISGSVIDEFGAPIANAAIYAGSPTVVWDGTQPPVATTDENGLYTVADLPYGNYQITAAASGYRTAPVESFQLPGGAAITVPTFQLARVLGSVEVLVVDDLRAPISGASVTLSFSYEPLFTDQAGTVMLNDVAPGTYTVIADDRSNAHLLTSADITVEYNQTTQVTLVLARTTTGVAGRVTDTAGNPIAGATASDRAGTSYAISAADGTYLLDLPAGTYFIGIAPPSDSVGAYVGPPSSEVTVVEGGFSQLDVVLLRSAIIRGTVAADGVPAEASITVHTGTGEQIASTTSDSSGVFSVFVPLAGTFRIHVVPNDPTLAEEWYPDSPNVAHAQPFDIALEGVTEIAVELEPAATLTGTLSAALSDAAAQSAIIEVWHVDVTPAASVATAYTLVGESFTFDRLRPGNYKIAAIPLDGQLGEVFDNVSSLTAGTSVAVGPSGQSAPVEIVLEPRPLPTVTSIEPRWFQQGTTTTVRIHGENFVDDLDTLALRIDDAIGESTLTLTHFVSSTELIAAVAVDPEVPYLEYSDASISIDGPALSLSYCRCNVTISQRPEPGQLRGLVQGPTGPAADVRVVALGATSDQTNVTYTDAGGAYAFDLDPGEYRLLFDPVGTALAYEWSPNAPTSAGATPVTVSRGSVTTRNETLATGGTVSGRVTGPTGQPLPEPVQVAAYAGTLRGLDGDYRTANTDAAGYYTISGLPTGNFTMVMDSIGQYATEFYKDALTERRATPVHVTAGRNTKKVDARLATDSDRFTVNSVTPNVFEPGTTTTAIVHGSGFTTADALALFSQYSETFGYVSVQVDSVIDDRTLAVTITVPAWTAAGGYSLRGLEFGGYLNAFGSLQTMCLSCVTVAGPQTSGGVHGVILDSSTYEPVPGASVTIRAWSDRDGGITVTTEADGSYAVTGLPVGSYKLLVQAFGYVTEYAFALPNGEPDFPIDVVSEATIDATFAIRRL